MKECKEDRKAMARAMKWIDSPHSFGKSDFKFKSYHFLDIKKFDIVLDIGANRGTFSILASEKAKHVYAIEPLHADILKKNVSINNISNITVLKTGLGNGRKRIEFEEEGKIIDLIPFDELLEQVGRYDFLRPLGKIEPLTRNAVIKFCFEIINNIHFGLVYSFVLAKGGED